MTAAAMSVEMMNLRDRLVANGLGGYAVYHALDWAEGKTDEAILAHIAECETYWDKGKGHPGNAQMTYDRIQALRGLLAHRARIVREIATTLGS